MRSVRLSLIALAASTATISAACADVAPAVSRSFVVIGSPAPQPKPGVSATPQNYEISKSVVMFGAPAAEKSNAVAAATSTPGPSQTSMSIVALGEPAAESIKVAAAAPNDAGQRQISASMVAFGEPAVEEFKVAAINPKRTPAPRTAVVLSPHEIGKARLAKIKFGITLRDKHPGPGAHANSPPTHVPDNLSGADEAATPVAAAAVPVDSFAEPGRHAQIDGGAAAPSAAVIAAPAMAASETADAAQPPTSAYPEPGRHAGSAIVLAAVAAAPAGAARAKAGERPANQANYPNSSMVDFGVDKVKPVKNALAAPAPGIATSTSIIAFGTPSAEDLDAAAPARNRRRLSGPIVIRAGVIGPAGAPALVTGASADAQKKADAPASDAAAKQDSAASPEAATAPGVSGSSQDASQDSGKDGAAPADVAADQTPPADVPTLKPPSNPYRNRFEQRAR